MVVIARTQLAAVRGQCREVTSGLVAGAVAESSWRGGVSWIQEDLASLGRKLPIEATCLHVYKSASLLLPTLSQAQK